MVMSPHEKTGKIEDERMGKKQSNNLKEIKRVQDKRNHKIQI